MQFHPESVLTEGGYQMLANWLAVCGDPEAPDRAEGLAPLMATAELASAGSRNRQPDDPPIHRLCTGASLWRASIIRA